MLRRSRGRLDRLPSPVPPLEVSTLDDELDQSCPLLVVGQFLDLELAEEGAQVRLDRVDAEAHLVGDLLVGGGGGEAAAVADRPAERDENAMLCVGQLQ